MPLDEILSEETQSLIDQMFEIARGEREELKDVVMVGLAAPQIGIAKRIILVDVGIDGKTKELGELKAYINPQIIWSSSETVEGKEGCFSVDGHIVGIVPRALVVEVAAYDRQGNPIQAQFSGYTARIF